jgi:hypothetical protein
MFYNLYITYGGRSFKKDMFVLGMTVTVLSQELSLQNSCGLPDADWVRHPWGGRRY